MFGNNAKNQQLEQINRSEETSLSSIMNVAIYQVYPDFYSQDECSLLTQIAEARSIPIEIRYLLCINDARETLTLISCGAFSHYTELAQLSRDEITLFTMLANKIEELMNETTITISDLLELEPRLRYNILDSVQRVVTLVNHENISFEHLSQLTADEFCAGLEDSPSEQAESILERFPGSRLGF